MPANSRPLLPTGVQHARLQFDSSQQLQQIDDRPAADAAAHHVTGTEKLTDLVPEFAPLRAMVERMLSGQLAEYRLSMIQRNDQDGAHYYYDLRLDPVRGSDDTVTGLALSIDDVTNTGRLTAEVAQLRRRVEHAQAMVDMVAHDLNTPLTLLNGYLEFVTGEAAANGNDTQLEYLRIMQNCVDRVMQTVTDMYDVVSSESGQLRVTLRTVRTDSLLADTLRISQVRLNSRGQRLVVHTSENLPALYCDELRAAQVLNNLVTNASKYSPAGSAITLKVEPTPKSRAVQFSVLDQGPGMNPEELKHAFDRAYRGPDAGMRTAGVGLGLYLARLLVELQGGKIWCESTPGRGSRFHFTLPTADAIAHVSGFSDEAAAAWST